MYKSEELEKRNKELKKLLRELGGLSELFPDIQKNYEEQISTIKSLNSTVKAYDDNQSARFGKKAKMKKEAAAKSEELSAKLSELEAMQKELEKEITPTPAFSAERSAELAELTDNFKTDEIAALPFEELASCFSRTAAKIAELNSAEQKNEILSERYRNQQKQLQKTFFEKLRETETFFIAYSPATHLPYADLREASKQSCMWLFTKEAYAKNCRNFFARQYIFIDIVKYSNKDFFEFSKNLPRLGFNAITLNNGIHNLTVETDPVIGNIRYSCPINPWLHARRMDFYQALLLFNKVPQTNHKLYEQYHNPMIMKAKESVMLNELAKAQYTLVMRTVKKTDENGKETEASEIPTNLKENTRFLLVFSDMPEFDAWKNASGFKTDEPGFAAKAMTFDSIDKLAAETNSELLLDRNGWCFELTKERREIIKQIAERVKNAEAAMNQNNK